MEEKNDIGMKHLAHEHLLILNENYIARKGDVCSGCGEQIDSCKSFVYSCDNISGTTSGVENPCVKFLLHKTCAELPPKIVNPTNKNQFLYLHFKPITHYCKLCLLSWEWFYYGAPNGDRLCLKCAVLLFQQSRKDPKIELPGHNHPLALIEHPSSFKCYACEVNDNVLDLSYRCTECQFWMHKSCGDAPPSFQFQFHKHPLVLSFSLPPQYQRFPQNCRLCQERMNAQNWLYYCGNCRFFTHFHCARSSTVLSLTENETCPNLVQLPAFDELSLNTLLEQFIKDKITVFDSYNNSSISSTTNYIKHWSHEEHDLKLITINELYDGKYDDEILLLCEGCGQPIQTSQSLFYGCAPCKYFMHKVCAEFPREIEHNRWPYESEKITANKYSQPFDLFLCYGCGVFFNGVYFNNHVSSFLHLHIGCVTLPEVIKHEAHPHQLQLVEFSDGDDCNACGHSNVSMYQCKKCKFYVCGRCIMNARTYEHRWDSHPLDLIYDAGMVEEHEHEFDCEFCSKEINPNNWFYHCSKCDLSFHTFCILDSSYRRYQYVKFGATDIKVEDQVHPHTLTFVLNTKSGRCMNCKCQSHGKPVLQCAPCNRTIFCYNWGKWCRPELGVRSYVYPPCIYVDNSHIWKW